MQSRSRKLLLGLIALLVLGFVVYRSSGMIHLPRFSDLGIVTGIAPEQFVTLPPSQAKSK